LDATEPQTPKPVFLQDFGVWAAGAAGRLPKFADIVPGYILAKGPLDGIDLLEDLALRRQQPDQARRNRAVPRRPSR
jgi:hypothetical protein